MPRMSCSNIARLQGSYYTLSCLLFDNIISFCTSTEKNIGSSYDLIEIEALTKNLIICLHFEIFIGKRKYDDQK